MTATSTEPATGSVPAPAAATADAEDLPRGDTLADKVSRNLRHALMTGELLPGQTLTVRGLAERFGVSLTPVREAVQRLVAEGALVVENARTLRVSRLDIETYRQILKIRLELEPMAARSAALRMDNETMARLDGVLAAHRAAIAAGQPHATLSANHAFHMTIYRSAGEPVLAAVIENLLLRVGPSLNLLFPRYCGSLTGVDLHEQAMDALRRRDSDALAEAIRGDLLHGSRYLLRLLMP